MQHQSPIICVRNLSVAFRVQDALQTVVRNVSFDINQGERLGIVGESGSGKSVTALSIMGLHDRGRVRYTSGEILYSGEDLLSQPESVVRRIRGKELAMIFQEPSISMNPVYPIGRQLVEPLVFHEGLDQRSAKNRMLELLDAVELRRAKERLNDYPHVFSGGELQRIMIAMALACRPALLIADEPTTALDVTIQAEVLQLLKTLQREFRMAVLLISHDLNLMQGFAERVLVMQTGELVEQQPVRELFERPAHPYTIKLMSSRPEGFAAAFDGVTPAILSARNICCHFPIKRGFMNRTVDVIKAVDDVSVEVGRGETLGVVGESGSGKSTLAKCLLQLQSYSGDVVFEGNELGAFRAKQLRSLRKDIQVVFQDPYSSLSPRMTVAKILGEGLDVHYPELSSAERRKRYVEVLDQVGLPQNILNRYPHEFSGGQRQRIAIARVMILKPKLVVLDEPTSSLDVSVQKQILALLRALQNEYGIAYIFITHDLALVRSMAHRILVMKEGRVVEQGDTRRVFNNPENNYTQQLIGAAVHV